MKRRRHLRPRRAKRVRRDLGREAIKRAMVKIAQREGELSYAVLGADGLVFHKGKSDGEF